MGAALRDEYRGWLAPTGGYAAAEYTSGGYAYAEEGEEFQDAWTTQPVLRAAPEPPAEAQPTRIASVRPTGFESARQVGEFVRSGTPVLMDVSEMADADAKRLVDFASGLIFGTRGSIERVARRVFLLAPRDVEVVVIDGPTDDTGFYNQS
ncbi:cell division protein SepF [Phaeacidiphilus oryzae]|jgi:cell division inhibitor SepF|uniref:cell division protein SepF n=1 Tax=Phaeacidiphilus oryzae TaxID=348818 RepID=UPI000AEEC94F|nr:cell division protein SepF [Phaeacidiphilus oryzae]